MKHIIKRLILLLLLFIYNLATGQIVSNRYSQERMYLHTDKTAYLTTEICWFKIYNTDLETHAPSEISKIAYVELIDNNSIPVIQEKIELIGGLGNGSIYLPLNLPTGNYTIRAYTNLMKNEGASVFFEKTISIYNPKDPSFTNLKKISAAPITKTVNAGDLKLGASFGKSISTRDKIEIVLTAKDASGNPISANMSMSIYKLDEMQAPDSSTIVNELSKKNNNPLLSLSYIPEYTGHIITGTIMNTISGKPISDAFVYFSIPGTYTQFKTSLSDQNGLFKFDMPGIHNQGKIIVQSDNQTSKINIDNPFYKASSSKINNQVDSISKELLLDRHINVQVENYYSSSKQKSFRQFNFDTSSFYYKADRTYLLDNYVRFSTLEEVIREYVTPITLTKRKGLFVMNVYDEEQKQFFENNPLVLLNGVPIFDVNKLLSYDPLKIRKLDVLMRTYYYGNTSFSGIVNLISYDGKIDDETLIPTNSYFDYEGLQKQRNFNTPLYETATQKETSLPDYRTTIQWTPNIDIPASGIKTIKTFSSDLPGKYIISIQGITKDGKLGAELIPFIVQ